MPLARYSVCLALMLSAAATLRGADKPTQTSAQPSEVSYYRDVRKVIQQNCQGCHQPAKSMGGYIMTSHAFLFEKGESGETPIVVGQPNKSKIVDMVNPHNGKPAAMPRGKEPLVDRDVKLIEKWIAQGAKDDTPATAREVVNEQHPPTYLLPPVITAIGFSPDGKILAVSGYHEVLLHNGDGSGTAVRLIGLSERIQSLAFSPDGKLLAVSGGDPGRFGEVQIWDVAKHKLKLSVPVTYDTVYGVSWSNDGSKIAFGCADNTLRAIDAATGKQILFQGAHSDWVLDTVFSLTSTHLVSVSRDRSMKLTEVATQRFVDNITSITPGALKGGLLAVARHPKKDELLIGGSDGVPKIYKMYREKKRVIGDDFNFIRAFEPLPGRIFAARFSADGNSIIVGSSLEGRGEVRIYQTADAKLVAKLDGVRGPVYAVAFRPDGSQVVSGGFDGMLRLNDAKTGKLVKEFLPFPMSKVTASAGTMR